MVGYSPERSMHIEQEETRGLGKDVRAWVSRWVMDSIQLYSMGVGGLTEIQKLQKLQNRAARIITGSNYDVPSKPLTETLGWRTIETAIQRETPVMVFKFVKGLSPQYVSELFVTSSTNACYNLRHTTTGLRLPKKLSSYGQQSFSFRGAALWNSLPSESKQASNLVTFRKSIL